MTAPTEITADRLAVIERDAKSALASHRSYADVREVIDLVAALRARDAEAVDWDAREAELETALAYARERVGVEYNARIVAESALAELEAENDKLLAAARMLREELSVSGHGKHACDATAWLEEPAREGSK